MCALCNLLLDGVKLCECHLEKPVAVKTNVSETYSVILPREKDKKRTIGSYSHVTPRTSHT